MSNYEHVRKLFQIQHVGIIGVNMKRIKYKN